MGCFFSKKSKRKPSESDERTTTVDTAATGNAASLGNSGGGEEPRQYSWDKREKASVELTAVPSRPAYLIIRLINLQISHRQAGSARRL